MKRPMLYRYSVLRYVHDVRTQEFLNVGVLFQAPEAGVLRFAGIERTGRLSGAFPGVDGRSLLACLERLAKDFARMEGQWPPGPIEEVRRAVLPEDDSSFQWAPAAGGLTADVETALGTVFQRHLGRYEKQTKRVGDESEALAALPVAAVAYKHKPAARIRRDTDVWNTLRVELAKRQVNSRLRKARISTPLRSYQFQHAWHHRRLHAIKPLALDGRSGDVIADKAAQWVGIMRDLLRSKEDFQLHLMVGVAKSAELEEPVARARELLCESVDGDRTKLHDESEAGELAEQIERDTAS